MKRRPGVLGPTRSRRAAIGEAYDRHGQQLFVLASVLTEDPGLAERIVIQAFMAHEGGEADRQELSASVLAAWLSWGPHARLPPGRTRPMVPPSAVMLQRLHALPDDQRTAVALCRFGDHTYREAAVVLGLPPGDVARLLGAAMRALTLRAFLAAPAA